MPSGPATAERVWPGAAALPMIITGEPSPAGKWAARSASPATESGLLTNDSAEVSPSAFIPATAKARAPRTRAVTIHTGRGRRATALPTRDQMPRLVGSVVPYAG